MDFYADIYNKMYATKKINAVFFDLDGTLVSLNNFYFRIETENYRKIWNIRLSRKVWNAGHGLPEKPFVENILKHYGISKKEADRKLPALWADRARRMKKAIAVIRVRPLPGTGEILRQLWRRKIPMVMITGNTKNTGSQVLNASGLKKYFAMDCYADKASSRAVFLRKSIRLLEKRIGKRLDRKKILVVGDTVHDILSGKRNGCRTRAVATGITPFSELKKHRPTYCLPNLKNTSQFLSLL